MNHAHHRPITREQREKQRALALAALTQITYLVESIAQTGTCDTARYEECIDALLADDYIADRSFSLGRAKVQRLLQGQEIAHAKHVLAHTATLISIEKKLSTQPGTLADIAAGMSRIHKQIQYFNSPYHHNVYAGLAHLYGETISTINPRVIIRGKPEHLKQAHNTEKVRCLLFSGIRAAWVWRTHGGSTMHLLFGRKKLIKQLESNVGAS